ncbi:MAG: hypothetical protein AB7O69_09040 [Burkholderiales bacterium]
MAEKFGAALIGWLQGQRHRLAWYVIFAPMLVLTVYYSLLASDRYVSESRLVIKRSAENGVEIGGFSLPFLGVSGGANTEDSVHLREYIYSQDIFDRLDQRLKLRDEFALKGLDFVRMMPPWATKEDYLERYRESVEFAWDDKSGVVVITTHGSAPDFALRFNEAILKESERFINELSQRVARDQMEFADQELLRARKELDKAKEKLLGYQNARNVLDPTTTAEVTTRVIAELEVQQAAREVELNTLSGMLQNDSAQVMALRQTLTGIRQQIAAEKAKLTSPKGRALNREAAEFLDYRAMVEFRGDVYKISLATLEKVRLEAVRKTKTLAVLSSPQVPEEAKYPQRLRTLGTWLFALCLLYGFIRLTIEIVEDHRD